MDALGARTTGREGVEPTLVEGMDGVPDRLRAASQTPGDLRRGLSARVRQKDLASAHHESIFGAQPRLEALALLLRKRTYKYWRFHAAHYSPSHTTSSEDALGGHLEVRAVFPEHPEDDVAVRGRWVGEPDAGRRGG
jgi:hypothetical protein